MPPYSVKLESAAFLADLKRPSRKHPQLKAVVIAKLEHVRQAPAEVGRQLQRAPLCFKIRVGADFRLVCHLRESDVIPVMLYAKNEHEDVLLNKLLASIEAVTRRVSDDE